MSALSPQRFGKQRFLANPYLRRAAFGICTFFFTSGAGGLICLIGVIIVMDRVKLQRLAVAVQMDIGSVVVVAVGVTMKSSVVAVAAGVIMKSDVVAVAAAVPMVAFSATLVASVALATAVALAPSVALATAAAPAKFVALVALEGVLPRLVAIVRVAVAALSIQDTLWLLPSLG